MALYEATGGDRWAIDTNWLSDEPLGDWYGVETDRQGRVVALRLIGGTQNVLGTEIPTGNGLRGMLPAALGNLSQAGCA